MGWFVWFVWVVWDLGAKAARRRGALQALPSWVDVDARRGRVERKEVEVAEDRCYRCSICGGLWPFLLIFSRCPECGHKCWSKRIRDDDEVTSSVEAMRIKAYYEFEEYCKRRDEKLIEDEIDKLRAADLTAELFSAS